MGWSLSVLIACFSIPALASFVLHFCCLDMLSWIENPVHCSVNLCGMEEAQYKFFIGQSTYSYWRVVFHVVHVVLTVSNFFAGTIPFLIRPQTDSFIIRRCPKWRLALYISMLVGQLPLFCEVITFTIVGRFSNFSRVPYWMEFNVDQICYRYWIIIGDFILCSFTYYVSRKFSEYFENMRMALIDPVGYALRRTRSNPFMADMLDMPKLPTYNEAIRMRVATRDEVPNVDNGGIEMEEFDSNGDAHAMESGNADESETIDVVINDDTIEDWDEDSTDSAMGTEASEGDTVNNIQVEMELEGKSHMLNAMKNGKLEGNKTAEKENVGGVEMELMGASNTLPNL